MRGTEQEQLTILLRADGNADVGAGHVVRSLSIADAALRAGVRVVFVTAGEEFAGLIRRQGIHHLVLHTVHRRMETELEDFLPLLERYRPGVLFVDSYYVSETYLRQVREAVAAHGGVLAYLDDVFAFAYPCDILVNYNVYAEDWRTRYEMSYHMPVPGRGTDGDAHAGDGLRTALLLGPAYAPLREAFRGAATRTVRERAVDVLISTGGADGGHMALALMRCVAGRLDAADTDAGALRYHFLIGAMSHDRAALEDLAAAYPQLETHYDVQDTATMMREADLAISAAGSTLYELCATQTPTLTYVLADNQQSGAEGFAVRGVMRCLGDIRSVGAMGLAGRLLDAACALAQDVDARREMAARMREVTDGRGADRIVEAVLRVREGNGIDDGSGKDLL